MTTKRVQCIAYSVLVYTYHALQLGYDPPRTVHGASERLWAALGRLTDILHVISLLANQ